MKAGAPVVATCYWPMPGFVALCADTAHQHGNFWTWIIPPNLLNVAFQLNVFLRFYVLLHIKRIILTSPSLLCKVNHLKFSRIQLHFGMQRFSALTATAPHTTTTTSHRRSSDRGQGEKVKLLVGTEIEKLPNSEEVNANMLYFYGPVP